jgi:hypothetical protein
MIFYYRWRKIQQLGLASEYKNEQSPIGTWLKHLFGLNTTDHRPITFSVGVQTHGPPAENRERVNTRLDFENITVDQIGAEMA